MTKPQITKRSVKGAALTFDEQDANFQNLKDATINITAGSGGTSVSIDLNGNLTLVAGTGVTLAGDNTTKTITINSTSGLTEVLQDTSPQLGGNLDVNGYQFVSTSNGNIVLNPDGTGNIQPQADEIIVGNGSTTAQVTIRPVSSKVLNLGKPLTDNAYIQIEATTGKIDIWTDNDQGVTMGSGPLKLIGYGGNAHITTTDNSTNLNLSTNNSGSPTTGILLNAGANGNIIMVAPGTGKIYFNSPTVVAVMTTTARDSYSATNGMLIYNGTTGKFQGYAAGAWVDLH